MIKKHRVFIGVYILIFILNIIAADGLFQIRWFIKPLIALSLAFYLTFHSGLRSGFNRLIFAALLFSLMGDCFLLFSTDISFMFGLSSFLIAHILYILAFYRDFKNDPLANKGFGHFIFFLTGIFSMIFYTILREQLQEFRIPVLIYIFFISIMLIMAAYRYRRVNFWSFQLIFGGALCFVISDALLAYNKFGMPFEYASVSIMGMYMLAQFLITMGVIERRVEIRSESG